jgi:hypothetical protein
MMNLLGSALFSQSQRSAMSQQQHTMALIQRQHNAYANQSQFGNALGFQGMGNSLANYDGEQLRAAFASAARKAVNGDCEYCGSSGSVVDHGTGLKCGNCGAS